MLLLEPTAFAGLLSWGLDLVPVVPVLGLLVIAVATYLCKRTRGKMLHALYICSCDPDIICGLILIWNFVHTRLNMWVPGMSTL